VSFCFCKFSHEIRPIFGFDPLGLKSVIEICDLSLGIIATVLLDFVDGLVQVHIPIKMVEQL
jgi:hypothetical protein